jgi:hypothetical protein
MIREDSAQFSQKSRKSQKHETFFLSKKKFLSQLRSDSLQKQNSFLSFFIHFQCHDFPANLNVSLSQQMLNYSQSVRLVIKLLHANKETSNQGDQIGRNFAY